jgi:hypothetical protein
MDENEKKSKKRLGWIPLALFLGIAGALLVEIAIPKFVHYGGTTPLNVCINNLRQIDAAKQQWVLENSKTNNEVPTWSDLKPFLGRGPEGSLKQLFCSGDKTKNCTNSYELGDLKTSPRCKIYSNHVLP